MLKLTTRQTLAAWIFFVLVLISLYYFFKGAAEFYTFYITVLCVIGRFVIFKPQDIESASTEDDGVEENDDAETGNSKEALAVITTEASNDGVVVSLAPLDGQEKATEDEAIDSEGPLNVEVAGDSEMTKPEQAPEEVTEAEEMKKKMAKRSWYIDHLKVYSIFVVVLLHVDCALGGCGARGWFLMVGQLQESRSFTWLFASVMAMGGGYIMPLFFGLSAVFVESSYLKRGRREFFAARSLRLLYPALFITFFMIPGLVAFGFWFTDGHVTYVPHPGHSWFLWVLLLLNWGFATFMESSKNDPVSESTEVKEVAFPGPLKRWTYGLIFNSLLPGVIWGLCTNLSGKDKVGSFMGMPFVFGGSTAYPFMFYVGYLAKKHGWVDKPIEEISGLDIRISCALIFVCCGVIAYLGGDLLQSKIEGYDSRTGDFGRLIAGLIAGPFGIETCICNIWLMQKFCNREFFFSKYVCIAAYTVFLIHPLVITGLAALYIKLHNDFRADDEITFGVRDSCDIVTNPLEDRFYCVAHAGEGGGDYALSAHFILHWSSQIIVWPLSLMVCRLPGLRKILSY